MIFSWIYDDLLDSLHNMPSTTTCTYMPHFEDCILVGNSEWVPLNRSHLICACPRHSSSNVLHPSPLEIALNLYIDEQCIQFIFKALHRKVSTTQAYLQFSVEKLFGNPVILHSHVFCLSHLVEDRSDIIASRSFKAKCLESKTAI